MDADNHEQYIPQLRELLRSQLKPTWLDENEWQEFEAEVLYQMDTSYDQMARQVAQAVEAGYPVSLQLSLVRDALKFLK